MGGGGGVGVTLWIVIHPPVQTMSVLPPQPGRSIWFIFPASYWKHLLCVGGGGVTAVVTLDLSHFGLFVLVRSVPPPSQE